MQEKAKEDRRRQGKVDRLAFALILQVNSDFLENFYIIDDNLKTRNDITKNRQLTQSQVFRQLKKVQVREKKERFQIGAADWTVPGLVRGLDHLRGFDAEFGSVQFRRDQ